MEELALDVVLIPSTGFEPWMNTFLHALRKKKVKSVLVPDNWDNLTSKNNLGVVPDAIVTLGKASAANLCKLLDVDPNIVWPIGIPKFSTITATPRSVSPTSKKLLFLGFSLPYAEIDTLNGLFFRLRRDFGNSLEVHYKPHPNRKSRIKAEAMLNQEIKVVQSKSRYLLPELNAGYRAFLQEYDIVIAPPTTMLLEFLLAGSAHIIQDDTLDSVHQTSPWIFSRKWIHVRDVESLCLPAGNGSSELHELVTQFMKNEGYRPSREQVDYVVTPKPENYHLLLSKKIDVLLGMHENALQGDFQSTKASRGKKL